MPRLSVNQLTESLKKARFPMVARRAAACHHDHNHMTIMDGRDMQISAAEFKAKCLKLMDQVARTREPIVITKRGRPVAKLVPPDEAKARTPLFGYLAGTVSIQGDIVNVPQVEWSALSEDDDVLYEILPERRSRSGKVAEPRKRGPHR